ncbi:hypothetical protein L4C31_02955 [Aliivibrio sifiae]
MAIGSTLRGTAGDSSAQDLREIVKLLQDQNDAKTKRDDELKKLITDLFGDQKDSESKDKESKDKRTKGNDEQPRKRKGTDKEKGNAKRDRSQPEKSNTKDDKKKAKSSDAFAQIMNQSGSAVQSTMSTFASLNSVVDMSHIQMNDFSTKAIAGATSLLSKGFTAALTKGAMRLNPYTAIAVEVFDRTFGKMQEFYQFMNEGAVNLQAFTRETGVSVGGQQGLRVAQAQSQLSLSELANVVDKGSRAFASLGKKELKRFTKQVGKLANSDLRMLGLASEDVANLLTYQLETERSRFAFDTKSRNTSNAARSSYIQTMMKMSKVTGKTAEEMAKISSGADLDQATKHLADQAQEMAYAAGIAAGMTEDEARASAQEQRAAMMSMAEEMSGGDKELMQSLIKRAVTGVDDALTAQIASAGGGDFLNDWTTVVQQGALDADAAVALSREHGSTIQQVSKELALISPELSNALGSVYNGLTVYADGVEKLQDSRTLLDVWESAITGWTSTATTTMSTAWTTFVQELFAIDGSLWGNISNAFSEAWKILKEGFANLFPDLSGMFDFDFFGDDETPEETAKKEKERIDNAGKYQQGGYAQPQTNTGYAYGMQYHQQYPPKVARQAETNIKNETAKSEAVAYESPLPEVNASLPKPRKEYVSDEIEDAGTLNFSRRNGTELIENNWDKVFGGRSLDNLLAKKEQYEALLAKSQSGEHTQFSEEYYSLFLKKLNSAIEPKMKERAESGSSALGLNEDIIKGALADVPAVASALTISSPDTIQTPLSEPPLAAPMQQVQEPVQREALTRDDVRSEVQGAMQDQSKEQDTQNRLDADAIGKAVAAELKPEMQQTNQYMAMQVGLAEDGNRERKKGNRGGNPQIN